MKTIIDNSLQHKAVSTQYDSLGVDTATVNDVDAYLWCFNFLLSNILLILAT